MLSLVYVFDVFVIGLCIVYTLPLVAFSFSISFILMIFVLVAFAAVWCPLSLALLYAYVYSLMMALDVERSGFRLIENFFVNTFLLV